MVEISLSGSGEGTGRGTGRGYSTAQRPGLRFRRGQRELAVGRQRRMPELHREPDADAERGRGNEEAEPLH